MDRRARLTTPYAIYSKSDPQTEETNKDYSMTSPLNSTGADFPAKLRCTKAIVDTITPVANLVANEDYEWTLGGTAVHNGGSCQVAISYDYCENMVVMASWIGGCPLSLPYKFKVPDIPGCEKCIFLFSWFNNSGNREMHQNAAVVSVTGTATSFTGPNAYRGNTFSDGSCINPEGTDLVFPRPGDQVIYGGSYSSDNPPSVADLSCPNWDNDKDITVSGDGTSSSETGVSGAASGGGAAATTTAAGAATGGGEAATITGAGANTAGGAATSKTTAATAAGGVATGTTGSTGTGSSSSTGSTSSSSSSSDDKLLFFGLVVLALLIIGGLVIWAIQRNKSSGAAGGGRYGATGRRRRGGDDDESSDSDSTESSEDEKPRRHRSRR
ncbi:hypothetical protein JCM8097_000846 [Rhodosporidiobolus ruineniae]